MILYIRVPTNVRIMKASSKHKLERITREEEKDVKASLREIEQGHFKETKSAKELIAWLRLQYSD